MHRYFPRRKFIRMWAMELGKLSRMLFYLWKCWLTWWFIFDDGWVVNSSFWGDGSLDIERQSVYKPRTKWTDHHSDFGFIGSLPLPMCCLTAPISNSQSETQISKFPLKNHIKFCVCLMDICLVYLHAHRRNSYLMLGEKLLKWVSWIFSFRNILYRRIRPVMTAASRF